MNNDIEQNEQNFEEDRAEDCSSRRSFLRGAVGTAGIGILGALGFRAYSQKTGPPLDELLEGATAAVDPRTAGIFVWDAAYAAPWTAQPLIQLYRLFSDHPSLVEKFRKLHNKLRQDGNLAEEDFSSVVTLSRSDYGKVHTKDYLDKLRNSANDPLYISGLLNTETPITLEILQLQGAFVNGTYTAAQIALAQGIAMNLGGGLHHAMPDREQGFCIFNDIGIAVKRLLGENSIRKAMLIDCDVHHGNGNAQLFYENPAVAIADFYQENNYPHKKIPVTLPLVFSTEKEWVDDEFYLAQLPRILEEVAKQQPDIIFYLAGADPYREDRLGGFSLTKEGLAARDAYIMTELRQMNISVAVLLAGGYAQNPDDLIDIHYNTAMIVKSASSLA